jgi:arylsulfatase A-like enzyme
VPHAYASGNYSVTAFHSLFTANHALYVNAERTRGDREGSAPLRVFRRIGYDIHLLASWDFSLNEYAFGDGRRLAATFVDSRTLMARGFTPADAHQTLQEWVAQWRLLGESLTKLDQRVVDLFVEHPALKAKRPQLVITYLGSTHWPYYWAGDRLARFEPYTDFMRGQFLYSLGERRRLMMNRYWNSVHYVDSLFGAMVDHLKRVGLYEDAIVVVLGDHGDEIYDHSRIGRGHLLNPEIRVPLVFKFERERRHTGVRFDEQIATTVSVLPTVLDHLGVGGEYVTLFDGASLFRGSGEVGVSWNEVASAEKALVVITRRHKAFFDIAREDPTKAQRLRLLEIRDSQDNLLAPLQPGTPATYMEFLMRNFPAMFRSTSSLPFVVEGAALRAAGV